MKTYYLKISALSLLFLSLVTATKAQLGPHIGFTAGPSLTTIYGDGADGAEMKLGYSAGFVYQHAFSARYALHTGVLFENKGAMSDVNLFGTDFTARTHFNYVTVPVLFRVHLMPEQRVRPFINAGVYGGYMVNQTTVVRDGDGEEIDRSTNSGDYRKLDVGGAGGLGVDFLIGEKMHFDVEVRDNIGFMNVNESDTDADRFSNNGVNLMLTAIWAIP